MLERSEPSKTTANKRFFTLTLAPSGVDRWFVQNDKYAKNVIPTVGAVQTCPPKKR